MKKLVLLSIAACCFLSAHVSAANIPGVSALQIADNKLNWIPPAGATGFNIYLDNQYLTTVRSTGMYLNENGGTARFRNQDGSYSFPLSRAGSYYVIPFTDDEIYGLTPQEGMQQYSIAPPTETEPTLNSLPKVEGVRIDGYKLKWQNLQGATGYNIYLDNMYIDTVIETNENQLTLELELTQNGEYHMIPFNADGIYGETHSTITGLPVYTVVRFDGC